MGYHVSVGGGGGYGERDFRGTKKRACSDKEMIASTGTPLCKFRCEGGNCMNRLTTIENLSIRVWLSDQISSTAWTNQHTSCTMHLPYYFLRISPAWRPYPTTASNTTARNDKAERLIHPDTHRVTLPATRAFRPFQPEYVNQTLHQSLHQRFEEKSGLAAT